MMKFKVGDLAQKIGGNYQATGAIVGAFRTLAGKERYVFEFHNPQGMLHIFTPEQLEIYEVKASCVKEAKEVMDRLTDEQRMGVMDNFCTHCGSRDPGCSCMKDD